MTLLEAYQTRRSEYIAFAEVYEEGFVDGRKYEKDKADADGCAGCEFEDVEEWEMPCAKCKRNCKDYWRARHVDDFEVTE